MPSLTVPDPQAEEQTPRTSADEAKTPRASSEPTPDLSVPPERPPLIFSPREKYVLAVLCSLIAILSTLLQPVFFPMLTPLREKFHVLQTLANMGVVCYLLFQGLLPCVVLNVSDFVGRRPVIIACILCYIASNIGLARANAYWLILVLRSCQAASIAPSVAISNGTVGDISTRADRGGLAGLASGLGILGQAFGTLIACGIMSGFNNSWRAVFWFLVIVGGCSLVLYLLLMPETRRLFVGDGSVVPGVLNRSPILALPSLRKRLVNNTASLEEKPALFDLLAPVRLVAHRQVVFALFPMAVHFSNWTLMATLLLTALTEQYHYSTIKVGLCYLPQGLAALVGLISCGRLLNWDYARQMKRHKEQGLGLPFNLYQARFGMLMYALVLSCLLLIVYGWVLDKTAHILLVLILSFVVLFATMYYVAPSMALMVDLFPLQASTAALLVNIFRCWCAALFVGVLDNMVRSMGLGGTYTLVAGLGLASNVLIWLLITRGPKWDQRHSI